MSCCGYFSVFFGVLKNITFVSALAFQVFLLCSCSRQSSDEVDIARPDPESKSVVAAVFQRWKLEDFGGVLSVGLEGHRSFLKGERTFVSLGCKDCHRMLADALNPNVASERIPLRHTIYSPEDLLAHILSSKSHSKDGQGLLNEMEQDGVLDLLAYVLSGADCASPFFIEAR